MGKWIPPSGKTSEFYMVKWIPPSILLGEKTCGTA